MMQKILVVEDNELNREMLSRRLIRRGYEIIEAVNGKEAVEASREHLPDLILMDIGLPVMDGWEATLQIKASEDTRHIPIIVLTAHATTEDRDTSREVGCDEYESKPVDFPRLLRKIELLLPLPSSIQ